jgi:hypothetical protein
VRLKNGELVHNNSGKKWVNNGIIEKCINSCDIIETGFKKGRLKKVK